MNDAHDVVLEQSRQEERQVCMQEAVPAARKIAVEQVLAALVLRGWSLLCQEGVPACHAHIEHAC